MVRPMSQRCIQCHRPITADRNTCLFCGGAAERVVDTRTFDCPGCQSEMKKLEIRGTVVDVCIRCRGQFYDQGELNVMLAETRRVTQDSAERTNASPQLSNIDNSISDTHSPRKCPVCGQYMHRRNFARLSGVIVDECFHGTFLDSGELKRIKKFVEAGGETLGDRKRQQEVLLARTERSHASQANDDLTVALLAASIADCIFS